MKPTLTFFTNMPTPYQLDFFMSLKDYFQLTVVYFSLRETDRQWKLSQSTDEYSVRTLKNMRLARLIQRRIPSFHFSWEIFSVVKEGNPDLVIVNGTYWAPNVIAAIVLNKRKKQTKVAYWGEPVFESSGLQHFLKRKLLWAVRKYTDFLMVIGSRADKCYRSYGYSKPIYNIPYNIDTALFDKSNLNNELMNKLSAKYKGNGELILLTSGSLINRKGIDTVIKAFLKVQRGLNASLLIMGDGEEKKNLVELADANPHIRFIGFQEKEEIPAWFNLADIFVFASRYDGWGLVINEALAANNAIICSNKVGAAEDVLIDNFNSYIFDSEDIDGLADKIKILITDPAVRENFKVNSTGAARSLSSAYNAKRVYEIARDLK